MKRTATDLMNGIRSGPKAISLCINFLPYFLQLLWIKYLILCRVAFAEFFALALGVVWYICIARTWPVFTPDIFAETCTESVEIEINIIDCINTLVAII